MKRLSLQWRMTLLTALLIACACICLNLLLYRSRAQPAWIPLGGYIMQYQPGDVEGLAIEIPDDQIFGFSHPFFAGGLRRQGALRLQGAGSSPPS